MNIMDDHEVSQEDAEVSVIEMKKRSLPCGWPLPPSPMVTNELRKTKTDRRFIVTKKIDNYQ
jgi:uncharacterized protein YgbK (DUF1537 family)